MYEVSADNVVEYLISQGVLEKGARARAETLAWGVSNVVLRITPETGIPFVVKQSREKLRTKADWFSRLDRIWRETEVMRLLHSLLPVGVIPAVLFEIRDNYLFGMEAAPADHSVWKGLLLAGQVDPSIAARLGTYLGIIHRETADRPDVRERFGDQTVFEELRVDPFYRKLILAVPEMAEPIERVIAQMQASAVCLVHADYSPKNVLISDGRIVLVDFETGHFGDPAFDLGFFLSHLLLKTVKFAYRFAEFNELTTTFWSSYVREIGTKPDHPLLGPEPLYFRTIGHLAGCMGARVDATSRVDYLDEHEQQIVRVFTRNLLFAPPANWQELLERLARMTAETY